MTDQPDLPAEDQTRLDELFGVFVETLTDGREVQLERLLADRIDLLPRAQELLDVAGQITVRRPVEAPHFVGYEILSEIGRGGMGKVYCVRHVELNRTEALKTLPAAWMTGDRARSRFEREARAVARLQHPGIIPIFDVGECDSVPYFTMEFVQGRTVAGVIDGLRGLGIESRDLTVSHVGREGSSAKGASYVKFAARLIRDVARALEHAHDEGVIHRDVKPSNIIVRKDGVPMLFDFGLASVEEEDALTLTGEFLGTPHYVSPEQAAGRRVTPSTDVFSLGSTLYEMLTLQRPFTGATTQDVLRAVREREPLAPVKLNGDVARDLETVCLTALSKEQNRRYPTAKAFADDLDRFLEGRPVHARSVGPIGRTLRMVRRYPAVSTAVLMGALLLFGTPTALLWQAREANEEIQSALDKAEASRLEAVAEKESAEKERDIATEIRAVLENMFDSVAPENLGREARIFEVLDGLAKDIESLRADVRAPLELVLADSYIALTLYEEAEPHRAAALELYKSLPETPLTVLLGVRSDGCTSAAVQGLYEETIENAGPLVDEFVAAGIFDENYIHAIIAYANGLLGMGRLEEAIDVLEEGNTNVLAASGGESSTTLDHNLGRAYAYGGRYEEGIALLQSARQRLLEEHGPDHPDPLAVLSLLAQVVQESGDLTLAAEYMGEALEGCLAVFGEENLMTLTVMHNLAGLHQREGNLEEAQRLEIRTGELAELHLPETHPLKGFIYEVLSTIQINLDLPSESLASQRRSLEARRDLFGEHHPETIRAHFFLGRRLLQTDDLEAAAAELIFGCEQLPDVPAVESAVAIVLHSELVKVYKAMGDDSLVAQAEKALEEAREKYGN